MEGNGLKSKTPPIAAGLLEPRVSLSSNAAPPGRHVVTVMMAVRGVTKKHQTGSIAKIASSVNSSR